MEIAEKYQNFKAGYVTIIGRPNCGKSTLMNNLLKFKLSIVSDKPQTTRQNILGILSGPDYQLVFIDTPGLLRPRYKLHETMMAAANKSIQEADLILYLIEMGKVDPRKELELLKRLDFKSKPVFLLINKIDLFSKSEILPLIDFYQGTALFREIIPISALKNDGLDTLTQLAIAALPNSPPFFPEDEIATAPERFFVAEIIREKIFLHYGEEIPYSTTVHVLEFKERAGGKDYIRANILVERATQRQILIGKGGLALKKIGLLARTEIEAFLDRPVYLELYVQVREHWRENPRLLKELGYAT
ncbi:GTPase Era [candidate division KSB1 bacterium]|nr:GTPase Era [candidate division KSB1 bacterium]